MAIAATTVLTAGSNVDAPSYATASVSLVSTDLILLWVYSIASSAPNVPTVTGAGLSWVQIDSQLDSGSLRRITLFRAMGTAVTGTCAIDFALQTQTGCAWSFVEYSGIDTSGTDGSGAIVQSAKGASAGNATSLTVTLAAFSNANNATVGGFGIPLNTAGLPAVGSGFTATGQVNQSTPNLSLGSEFNSGNDATVDMNSSASSVPWVGIAVEIKDGSTPPTNLFFF